MKVLGYVVKKGNISPDRAARLNNICETNTWKIIGNDIYDYKCEPITKDLEIGTLYHSKKVVGDISELE